MTAILLQWLIAENILHIIPAVLIWQLNNKTLRSFMTEGWLKKYMTYYYCYPALFNKYAINRQQWCLFL